jgi:hypothetical protein
LREQISSKLSAFMRWWMVIGGALALVAVVATTIASKNPVVLVGLAPVVVFGLLARHLWSCQRVVLADDALVVGDGERLIPFREVAEIRGGRFGNPPVVTIRLQTGEQIRFLATTRAFGLGTHPVIDQLRSRIR